MCKFSVFKLKCQKSQFFVDIVGQNLGFIGHNFKKVNIWSKLEVEMCQNFGFSKLKCQKSQLFVNILGRNFKIVNFWFTTLYDEICRNLVFFLGQDLGFWSIFGRNCVSKYVQIWVLW